MRTLILIVMLLMMSPALAKDSRFEFPVRFAGGRIDWGPQGLIALERPNEGNWSQIWVMKEDGSDLECLSCGEGYSKLHNGNPAWHPSGDYIVYQALDDRIKRPFWGALYQLYTSPGSGVNNNLWVMTADGAHAWPLTNLGKGRGVLHPHFSHDGKHLLWAEMEDTKPLPTGKWVMKIASFAVQGGKPVLENIRTLKPGNLLFYETHSFSPDDAEILFTGKNSDSNFDIYKYNLSTRELTPLTERSENFWDEHAHFSPDGQKIVWMSSKDNDGSQKGGFVKTDWWMMDADGANKHRLTYFNKKTAPEYIKGKAIAADISWSPDGKKLAGYLQDNASAEKPGHVVIFGTE